MKRIEKVIVLSDDLDGSEENVNTIVYAIDGEVFEIDLNAKNARRFRDAMKPFTAVSRKTTKAHLLRTLPKSRAGRPRSVPAERPRREEVKETIPETPQVPETPEGLESQALSAPEGTSVPPTTFRPPDFQGTDSGDADDIPQEWRACMPREGESHTEAAQKTKMWGVLIGRPVEKVTPEMVADWRAFYIKRLWTLVDPKE